MNAAKKAAQRRRFARAERRNTSAKQRRVRLNREPLRSDKRLCGRAALPAEYRGVTRFSDEADRYGGVQLVRLAKSCGLLDDLIKRTTYAWGGRTRIKGTWVLAYLAFVNSRFADFQPWLADTGAELWWECGFDEKPRYPTVYRRFKELEELATEDLFGASSDIVKLAIDKSGGNVAFDLVVDCTEAETNARLHHDCQPEDHCPGVTEFVTNRHGRRVPKNDKVARAASTAEAKAHREEANAQPFPDDPNDARMLAGDVEEITYEDNDDCVRVKVGNHWWRLGDPEAGVRAYTRGDTLIKFWSGYYNLKATCVFFGAPIFNIVEAADEQEWNLFDEVLARIDLICGTDHVRAILTDRGFAVNPVFQACTERDITLVCPLRAEVGDDGAPRDREQFDRDGIPRCKHCGGPTEFVRFSTGPKDKPKPRLWFRCARPYLTDEFGEPTDRCTKEQSISCSADWRYLLPLWRNTEAYQALANLSFAFERSHHLARRRTNTAGNTEATRPRRVGRNCQQARANAGVLLDWLKIADRMGYLPGSIMRLTNNDDIPVLVEAEDFVKRINAERRAEGLNRPYGPAAVKLDIGVLLPTRKNVLDADTNTINASAATDTATAEPSIFDPRIDTSRDLGDTDSAHGPPERPPGDPPDGDIPF